MGRMTGDGRLHMTFPNEPNRVALTGTAFVFDQAHNLCHAVNRAWADSVVRQHLKETVWIRPVAG